MRSYGFRWWPYLGFLGLTPYVVAVWRRLRRRAPLTES